MPSEQRTSGLREFGGAQFLRVVVIDGVEAVSVDVARTEHIHHHLDTLRPVVLDRGEQRRLVAIRFGQRVAIEEDGFVE